MRPVGLRALLADNANAKAKQPLRAELLGAEATIYLYDVIVSDASYGGVGSEDFVKTLVASAATADTIHLRINCPGGDVFAARTMESAVRACTKRVVAHVDGYAASAASYLALACDEVEIAQGGFFMIHKAWTLAMGDSADMAATSDLLAKIDASLVDTYAAETGQSPEKITDMMAAETWITAQEAVELGFADRIAKDAPKASGAWNLAAYANAPKHAHPNAKKLLHPGHASGSNRNDKMLNPSDLRAAANSKRIEAKLLADRIPQDQWTAENQQQYTALQGEADTFDAEYTKFQNVLDRAGEDITRRKGGGSRGSVNDADVTNALAALGNYARTGEREGFGIQGAALTGAPDSGGVLVPHELSDTIISTQKKHDPMRQVCRVISSLTTASKYSQPIFNGGLDSGWVSETDARPTGSIAALELGLTNPHLLEAFDHATRLGVVGDGFLGICADPCKDTNARAVEKSIFEARPPVGVKYARNAEMFNAGANSVRHNPGRFGDTHAPTDTLACCYVQDRDDFRPKWAAMFRVLHLEIRRVAVARVDVRG